MPNNYFKNTSIAKKLYFTVGIMAFLIIIELCVLGFALSTLSAIRSYVSGEGLWSKAQKDAIWHLRIYAYSGNDADYQAYLKYLKVPLGDGKARDALGKTPPDRQMARQGFLAGRNHPDDIEGMINLMLRFHNNYYLARTIYHWGKAEAALRKLMPVAEQLHEAALSGELHHEQTLTFLKRIDEINDEITPSEDGFSYSLGEGSRWLEHLVLRILMALALTVETTGIIIAVSISRNIQRGLGGIIKVAKELAEGKFDKRVEINSADEIGTLGTAFNAMAGHLEDIIDQYKDSEIKLRSFFDNTRACHVLMDRQLNIIYSNQAAIEFARKHYHFELKEGIPVAWWVHPDRLESFRNNCEMAMSGEVVMEERPIIYQDGESFWWSITYAGARNAAGDIVGVSYHAIDVTHRVQQEQEIRIQNESLRQIAYFQSHEMRRPVASILGLMNVFETEDFKPTKEELMMLKQLGVELDEQIHHIVKQVNV